MDKQFWKSQEDNEALTQNLDKAYKSTLSFVLDLFSRGGAYRSRTDEDCVELFSRAFAEDKNLAMRCLFYLRDVRCGIGERRFFRIALKYLATIQPDIVAKNIKNIPEFGRWDDIFVLLHTSVEKKAIDLISEQIEKDKTSENVSLLGKWMPSNVTSSKSTVSDARRVGHLLDLTPKEYRKMLSGLRRKIKIVESKMSANQWGEIEYDHVPSKASLNYSKAFKRHDEERYGQFITAVKDGTKKIHAGVLYPYEIVRKILLGDIDVPALDVLWKSLPDYAGNQNAIVLCDTSGSMNELQQGDGVKYSAKVSTGLKLPISISVGLALYFAERNTNEAFKMRFLTFSKRPELQYIKGDTIVEKVMNLLKAAWDGNTDLRLAFKTILDRAKQCNVPADEMPRVLYVISDMQFDAAFERHSTYDDVKQMYADSGYVLPTVVFWQVNAFTSNSPVTIKDSNTILVSGSSPVVFKFVLESKSMDPVDFMKQVLGQERYDSVRADCSVTVSWPGR